MKYLKPINEFWGDVLKRDLLGETREEDRFHNKNELREYLKSEIEKQGENVVIQNLDVSLVENLSELFYDGLYDNVKTLDLSGWKTSNVEDMEGMFYECKNLKSLDLSGWNTCSVVTMNSMFQDCNSLKSLDLSGWDTSNLTDMALMFSGCKSLKSLNLSGWNTSNVKYMNYMFADCRYLKSLDLSGWDTSGVENMHILHNMFRNCPAPYEVIDKEIVKK